MHILNAYMYLGIVCMWMCVCVCMYVCMHVYMHVCMASTKYTDIGNNHDSLIYYAIIK